MSPNTRLSVALVYDKVNTPYGGAEWVLLALHKAFPDAPLYTSLYAPKRAPWAAVFKVVPSFLQTLPIRNHKLLVWLFPLAFETLDLSQYDVVLSITSGEAKGVITNPNQVHICYLLTPPRYLYSHAQQYKNSSWILKLPGIRQIATFALRYLRWWDSAAAARPDVLISISKTIQKRTQEIYGRDSQILYPPLPQMPQLQTDEVLPIETPYLLSLSRLVAYKQVALSIGAALRTGSTLLIAGEGEEKRRLVSLAGTHAYIRKEELLATFLRKYSSIPGAILFLGTVTDTERLHLLKQAEALLMPGIEDFGITALEAAYLGTPSILHKDSGVSEVLLAGTHAVHLESESVEALVTAVTSFKKQKFSAEALKKQAETCSTTLFTRKMIKHVYDSIIRTKKPSSNTT